MKSSAIDNKTVRPGLVRYSVYASNRQPANNFKAEKPRHRSRRLVGFILVILILAGGAAYAFKPTPTAIKQTLNTTNRQILTKTTPTPVVSKTPAVAAAPTNYCAGNTLDELIKVSISQRHLWACQEAQEVYDTPVVTGIEYLAADLTPAGTYHIYGKYTDTTLRGCDTTGCWNDYVNYWMPFLHNEYGSYGLHDATWRSPGDFGNISPDSSNASHGCVELPLGAAKWLYDWASIGTTVTVQS
jgi:lipoprotein-anchoring transpeptidase ErfK/SrfK